MSPLGHCGTTIFFFLVKTTLYSVSFFLRCGNNAARERESKQGQLNIPIAYKP